MVEIDEMCNLCTQVTKEPSEMPLLDQMEEYDDERPWKESR